jgi:hypothetical protein
MNHQGDDWGDDGGLGPALDAYARERLEADPQRTEQARIQVMAAARTRAGGQAAAAARRDAAGRRWWGFLPRLLRSPALAGAGLLVALVAAGGVMAGTAPGGPLYGARLWLEELQLPAAPEARTEAQLGRLEGRLEEARTAAERGDVGAVEAALESYRHTAEDALAAASDAENRREVVEERFARHVAVLEALADRVPERAAEAIRAAAERTEARLREIVEERPGRGRGPREDPRAQPDRTPRPETEPDRTPRPRATPDPGRGPKATPEPTRTPKPQVTPEPKETPPGRADETPGRGQPPATPTP